MHGNELSRGFDKDFGQPAFLKENCAPKRLININFLVCRVSIQYIFYHLDK